MQLVRLYLEKGLALIHILELNQDIKSYLEKMS